MCGASGLTASGRSCRITISAECGHAHRHAASHGQSGRYASMAMAYGELERFAFRATAITFQFTTVRVDRWPMCFARYAERAAARRPHFLLYDAFGFQPIPEDHRAALLKSGIAVVPFRPLRVTTLHTWQNRSHVRGIVIDGRIGWTGGFGIDEKWLGDGRTNGWGETNARFRARRYASSKPRLLPRGPKPRASVQRTGNTGFLGRRPRRSRPSLRDTDDGYDGGRAIHRALDRRGDKDPLHDECVLRSR